MAASSTNRVVRTPDNSLITVRPQMAKADIRDNAAVSDLSLLIKESSKRAHGKQGVAAAVLQKQESNFSRDIDAGRITSADLAHLGPQFLAELGKELVNAYGPLAQTPAQQAEQKLDEIQAALNEVRQYVRLTA